MFKGELPVIVAHNNTIRGLIKTIKGLTKEEVMKVEIPNSIPIVFNFDDQMNYVSDQALATEEDQKTYVKSFEKITDYND